MGKAMIYEKSTIVQSFSCRSTRHLFKILCFCFCFYMLYSLLAKLLHKMNSGKHYSNCCISLLSLILNTALRLKKKTLLLPKGTRIQWCARSLPLGTNTWVLLCCYCKFQVYWYMQCWKDTSQMRYKPTIDNACIFNPNTMHDQSISNQ